jgi:hypothetical protein
VLDEFSYLAGRQRVLADRENRVVVVGFQVLVQIVAGETADDHAVFSPERERVVGTVLGAAQQLGLLFGELLVLDAGVGRQQGPLLDLLVGLELILGNLVAGGDAGTAVGDAGDHPHHDRHRQLFGEFEGFEHHVVALLLVARLETGDERELGEITTVLLVLRGVHAGVVCDREDEATVGAGDRGVHECIGGDVEADVFHAHQGALAGPTHPQRLLVGDLLVGRPECVDIAGLFCATIDKLEDLGRRRSGIGVDAAKPGMDGTEADGLVTEENLSVHSCSLRRVDNCSRGASRCASSGCEVSHNRGWASIAPPAHPPDS